jgi:hypothetical protein
MCRRHTRLQWWTIVLALLVVITSITSGCGPRPPQVEIVVSPSISTLEVGRTLSLSANASGGGTLRYQWRFTGPGKLEEPTTDPAVVYRSTEPGNVVVTVEVTDEKGQTTTKSYSFVVGSSIETVEPPPPEPLPPTPEPVVEITKPLDTIDCPGTGACRFTVEGTSSNVVTNRDLRIYVLVFPVDPVGSGWYLQVSPATVRQDGTWSQMPAWLGDDEYPAKSGDTLQIVALVVHRDADWNGTKLSDWSPGAALPTYQDIDYMAVSDIIDLRVN